MSEESLRLDADRAPAPAARVRTGGSVPMVQFVTRFDIGGTEKQVVAMARRFAGSRFALRFACLRIGGAMDDREFRSSFAVSEYPIRTFLGGGAALQVLRFARDLRRDGVGVVHSYNFYANLFGVAGARLAGVPCVVASIRDMGVYSTPAQRRAQKWVCRLADRVVVNAEAIRRQLVGEGYAAGKIRVIRNGLELPGGDSVDAAALDRELGIPPGARVVLMLSRLNPQKGVEYLLEAAARVLVAHPETRFVIVGDVVMSRTGPRDTPANDYMAALSRTAERLGISGRVVFTGVRRDVASFLARADVSVLPSFSEGLSNSILESMAAGLPVVATSVGGTPELIEHRQNGLLVPPRDARALAGAIESLLANPFLARRLGDEAQRRVRHEYSFERMQRETEALYEEILASKRIRGRRGGRMQGARP